jgi:hypothetical protein
MTGPSLCRSCDKQPRLPGSLYCTSCKADIDSFTEAAQTREHPPNTCWCPDCAQEDQRAFRAQQAQVRRARELAERASVPLNFDPPDQPGPRVA